jgi:hypothetical protein
MSTISVDTVDTIYNSFNDKATKIDGTPNIDTLRALRSQLKSNAANIQSNLGGGNHGDLGLILSEEAYALAAPGTPYTRPSNPGQLPQFPGAPTGPQIAAIERLHQVQLFEFNRYKNVESALKRFLIHSVDDIFIHALHQQHIGYANRTTQELLDHMFASYGRVHPDDLVANTKRMQSPWDPNTPFEQLAKQIDDCADFADAANQPYSHAQILTQSYSLVFATGLYERQLEEWDNKNHADKTWDTFKSFFLVAQTNLMFNRRATAGRQGYGHLAQQQHHPQPPFQQQNSNKENPATDNQENELTDALALLTTAANADRTAFATITSSNQQLTQQLTDAMTRLADLEKKLHRNRGGGRDPGDTTRYALPNNKNYCHTHGYVVANEHTSATCNAKGDGHKDTATRADTMGGSTRNKHRIKDF